jgi:ABC-type sulfate transport system substrate-binding protein
VGLGNRANGGDEATRFVGYLTRLFKNVPVLDTGARGSTTTFVERGIGDVLLAWENEALLTLATPAPARQVRDRGAVDQHQGGAAGGLVDKNVAKHGTRKQAEAYLRFLYSAEGPGAGREAFLSPVRAGQGAGGAARAVPGDLAGDHRRRVRRLEEGTGRALRRWRLLRSHLQALIG